VAKFAILVGVLALSLAACANTVRTELVVSAASSLTNAFGEIALAFEATHPDVDVVMNLAGSSTLSEQILQGAPADLFASADQKNMDKVASSKLVEGTPQVFARNSLTIAVPTGNPGNVTGLDDFGNPDLLIGLCAAAVPCGDLARQALEMASVEAMVDTNESDVRALTTKLELGELDAGIIYKSDLVGSSGLEEIVISQEVNVTTDYPVAVLSRSTNRDVADEFVKFLLSPEGQGILARFGFDAP
jgi:molybdate transport system substrate-binding protein